MSGVVHPPGEGGKRRAPSKRRWGSRLVLLAPALWLALFVLVPLLIVVRMSVSESVRARPPYRPQLPASLDPELWREALGELTLDNYRDLAASSLYGEALLTSLGLAFVATAIILVSGYGIALAVARAPQNWRMILLAAVVLPFWTSFLVRVYAWIGILKSDGWLNQAFLALGLISAPLAILNTNAAVVIGLVYAYLPFMILPLHASLEKQDPALLEAAADLGASPLRRFWTVTVPLSLPGIVAGSLLCFIPMVGEFVVPELLGGTETLMLGRVLWSEFFSNANWPLASAIAVVLLAILILPIVALRESERRRQEAAS
ncbi:ABC transporter permease [Enterovirga rhinocerotis]|uniref:Putrescine transport system permease protein n=1 Tax=Enterovirga rhinocerotis TaxID=1339210 RepID=A0A4R7BVE5_9HYPH|nr:putrescine transport system permease protein [Enterovirga rhinocerotis]